MEVYESIKLARQHYRGKEIDPRQLFMAINNILDFAEKNLKQKDGEEKFNLEINKDYGKQLNMNLW